MGANRNLPVALGVWLGACSNLLFTQRAVAIALSYNLVDGQVVAVSVVSARLVGLENGLSFAVLGERGEVT